MHVKYIVIGDLDECGKELMEYRERGESVFIMFNGHKLYSCEATSMDYVYQEIIGMTKDEFEKKEEERREEYRRKEEQEKAEAEARKPEWVERGSSLIYPLRLEEWEKCVDARASDLYHGWDLEAALEIMEKLESGASIEEVKAIFEEQGHSGFSAPMVRSIILQFSKRGIEFFEETSFRELSNDQKRVLKIKRKENEIMEKLQNSENITPELLEGLSLTESWLNIQDIQKILTEEQYAELIDAKKAKLEEKYKRYHITEEELKKEIKGETEGTVFTIERDEQGKFILNEFARYGLSKELNLDEIDETKLATVVERAMQKHLDYDRFHTNKELSAEQIPDVLKFHIRAAKECISRNKDKSSKTPLQQREAELSSLEAEEKTISEAETLLEQQKKGQNIGDE